MLSLIVWGNLERIKLYVYMICWCHKLWNEYYEITMCRNKKKQEV